MFGSINATTRPMTASDCKQKLAVATNLFCRIGRWLDSYPADCPFERYESAATQLLPIVKEVDNWLLGADTRVRFVEEACRINGKSPYDASALNFARLYSDAEWVQAASPEFLVSLDEFIVEEHESALRSEEFAKFVPDGIELTFSPYDHHRAASVKFNFALVSVHAAFAHIVGGEKRFGSVPEFLLQNHPRYSEYVKTFAFVLPRLSELNVEAVNRDLTQRRDALFGNEVQPVNDDPKTRTEQTVGIDEEFFTGNQLEAMFGFRHANGGTARGWVARGWITPVDKNGYRGASRFNQAAVEALAAKLNKPPNVSEL